MAERKNASADDLGEVRRRYSAAKYYCAASYDEAIADQKFVTVPGHQWDEKLKARRGDRPTYEFPKLRGHVRQVVNEMRQSRPQGKVRGAEESDRGLAEIMQGLCRNIESVSNADRAYDIAYQSAVQGGLGHWRIFPDYRSDDDFEQDIFIKPIRNFATVKWDPAAMEIDRRDARYCFVEDRVPRSQFEADYPNASLEDFDDDWQCAGWREADTITVAEYIWKEPMKRELVALSDGRVLFLDELQLDDAAIAANGLSIAARRVVNSHKVYSRLTNGHEWLDKAYDWPTKFIPIVPVWGENQFVGNEEHWQGLVRSSKDQQRLHNVHRTAAIEAVAKAPKAPFVLKKKWIAGLERFWNRANAEDYPYLPLNDSAPDNAQPQRAAQAEVPAALIQLGAMDNDDIKAATGQYDASLGARSNETSGRAISQRKQQGATATFDYIDNLAYAIRYTYEILVDMVPRVYDTQRVVRILGPDGSEKWKTLYEEVVDPATGRTVVLNDIRKGKYDVVITVGPNYATQRMEAVEQFSQLAGQIGPAFPMIAPLLAYMVVRNLDVPGSEELDDALRKALVQQGLLPPKEGDQPPQAPPPDPRMEAQVRKLLADADKSAATAAKTRAETETVLPLASADARKTAAETAALGLRNLAASGEMAAVSAALAGQNLLIPAPRASTPLADGVPTFTG